MRDTVCDVDNAGMVSKSNVRSVQPKETGVQQLSKPNVGLRWSSTSGEIESDESTKRMTMWEITEQIIPRSLKVSGCISTTGMTK